METRHFELSSKLKYLLNYYPKQSCANIQTVSLIFLVDPGGPVVIILSSESEVRGLDPGRGRWFFSERKNPKYDFLRKGSKVVGPVS